MSFTERRLELILDALNLEQRVNVKVLSKRLRVSPESIRRDLKELEVRGHARRVYGGAVLNQHESDQPFGERIRIGAREKARIGEAAAALVADGMKIFVDTGTTTLACLKYLEERKDVTIVTNSIAVAAHFFNFPAARIRVLGGRMRPEYQATYGHETVTALKEHFFDLAIIAISAIHSERGFMDFGEDEAILRRVARAQAKRAVIVADSSKFGRLGSIHTLALDQIDAVVSSGVIGREFSDKFAQSKVEVINA
jgi:DeoR family transcriptional regulator, carbon catabolite repression regulator